MSQAAKRADKPMHDETRRFLTAFRAAGASQPLIALLAAWLGGLRAEHRLYVDDYLRDVLAHDGPPPAEPTQSRVFPSVYMVACIPPTNVNYMAYAVTVEWRGPKSKTDPQEWWCVKWLGSTLNADGEWEWEPSPSGRGDDYLDRCRFDLDTALRLAREAAPNITVNGYTVQDVLDRAAANGG